MTHEFYASPRRLVLLLLVCLAFVLVGAGLLVSDDSGGRMTGLASVLFFGVGVGVAAKQLLDRRPRLVLDAHGVTDRTLGVGRIAWSDVRAAHLVRIGRNPFIALTLRDPEVYLARLTAMKQRLARANATVGMPPLSLNLMSVAARPEDVLALVHQAIARASGPPPFAGPSASPFGV